MSTTTLFDARAPFCGIRSDCLAHFTTPLPLGC
jgi:hypothetical protein